MAGGDVVDAFLACSELPPPGGLGRIEIGGVPVAVLNVGGSVHAVEDECPHDGCAFSEDGALEGEELVCECHGSRFEARTGRLLAGPAYDDARSCAVARHGDGYVVSVADAG
jgi:nitrite reductase/ring-hydroxylating ferredoxin subunit